MAMTGTLTNVLRLADGTFGVGVPVTARLVPLGGFRIDDNSEILAPAATLSASTGAWSLILEQTSNIFPAGSYWEVTENLTTEQARIWSVAIGTGFQTLRSALISPPAAGSTQISLSTNNTWTGTNTFTGAVLGLGSVSAETTRAQLAETTETARALAAEALLAPSALVPKLAANNTFTGFQILGNGAQLGGNAGASQIIDVPGANGRGLSMQSPTQAGGTAGMMLQLIPDSAVNPAGITTQIQLFNKTGDLYQRFDLSCVNGGVVIDSTAHNTSPALPISIAVGGNVASATRSTILAASNNHVLPQATIDVAATAGFPTSGVVTITHADQSTDQVTYTGLTSLTLTGCTGGAGTLRTGDMVAVYIRSATSIFIHADGSIDLLASPSYSLDAETWNATGPRFADTVNLGTSVFISDTRTGTPASNAADTAYWDVRRGGSRKWLVGLNTSGANTDSFDFVVPGSSATNLQLNATGTMVFNGRTGDTRLIVDTRTAGGAAGDGSTVQFQKAGAAKVQIGLNFSGGTADNLDFYIQGVGLAMQVTQTQSVLVGKAAPGLSATDGFPYIPADAGTPTGVPTTKAGMVAVKYDTTAHKLWIYDSGWKGVVVS